MQEQWPKRSCRRGVAAGFLGALALLSLGLPVSAGAAAVQSLPGCTANTLPTGDDNSSDVVPLGFSANFFGRSFSSLYVNQNGNVSFTAPLSTFTPFDFTTSSTVIIAPFLADVDTAGQGSALATYGQTTVDGQPAFCVNWVNVGYYNDHADKLNSFQLLLISRGPNLGDFDIVFNYDKVLWETGDANGGSAGFGGTPAAVGFTNGDGSSAHSHLQPGSLTSLALIDSNSGTGLIHGSRGSSQLGRYVFAVRNAPDPPTLGEDVSVAEVSGTVLVDTPGGGGFVPLNRLRSIPVGSLLNTKRGVVRLTSARDRRGNTQTGKFEDGIFKVLQGRRSGGLTDLLLRGGNFGPCRGAAKPGASASLTRRQIRRLRARARGRFRTRGRYSASTVRSTDWTVTDRCDGTLTRVRRGAVTVRDLPRDRTVVVRAGQSYLARAPGA
jgi:hypothetical protein